MNNIRVLLVDDDEDDYILTIDYLNEIPNTKFEIDWANNFNSALEYIHTNAHDIYIFDFLLGAKTGLELLKQALKVGYEGPVILLTGKGDQKVDSEAMRLGAYDYLVKGALDSEKLERSIRYALDKANTIKALKESERKYRNVFEQSKDMIYITNSFGDFVSVNKSGTELLGYSNDEFFDMKANQIWDSEVYKEIFEINMAENGEINDFEVVLKTKTDEKKFCIISATAQTDNNNITYYQCIVHDITTRRKTERASTLSEKMGATNRLVRTLAHEVRNPLTNINLSIENLESEINDDLLQAYLDIIKRNSKRINDLITELLNSSRPSEIVLKKHSIIDIVEATLQEAADRINLKNITLVKEYDSNCNIVSIDESKIRIAFLNLVINAIEAMEEHKGILKVSISSKESKCIVNIEDNGVGIPKEDLSRLFEPYFTSKPTGMGLGLAATLNIIQSHKALIEVESEVGHGTKFNIAFNLDE